jgi:transcription elongation factor GreA
MTDKVILTRGGYEKMRSELEFMMTTKRRQIAKDLETARAFGDLRENAEYDAAKNAQAHNEKRISLLSEKLQRAEILDDSKIDKNKALLGATVRMQDLASKAELSYTLVSTEEADYKQNKVSITSPVGKAILGHAVGDEVAFKVPAGNLRYKILKIQR